ncbi:hypothetical protein AGABI1DRAFT_116254 [Agaricus bisporus var. burnettii JB137-S8]|uniref:CBS domain-containing protein n=2 Tax=Agaricus bisporus var. burnettii TaxID=192524 RepID=K5WK53_AGABU|nr:hypothetical protein AGABI2DRAFT_194590 [Agaricus bisporus var. bisporus H97]XP_007333713.1 uncharacterized protein AGABI1DRAFT_116254 [Agaricus bisporus var. burnettii JB137-S8]EKM75651.1 hypothetical protein AGABI1DRAFT_116254 [Agaricus bisporus var. burnettii JB137-S8]EKV44632.1 hypothetical protein AGABI2DRAFT_194590 [Agaricus bisporus var. bisporus H97]KAF7761504.1 hypothetical protein Agabi119p4_9496 [Agaricus bisporus var. burnettii]
MAATMTSPLQQSSSPAFYTDKYRGAVVEDLQLSPAFALPSTEPISRAIELAYEREFSHIPVLDKNRRPLGYIDVADLKKKWEAGQADPNDRISKYMVKFIRNASEPYIVITPLTPLSDIEDFLKSHDFALVTDYDRKFVLGVATPQDLENFVTRRGS